MNKLLLGITLCLALTTGFSREVPSLSAKGVEYFKNGQYSRAKRLLTQALKKSLLSARDDWVIKATLNLAEIEMAAGHYKSVDKLLQSLPLKVEPDLKRLILWKQGQNYFYQNEMESAESTLNQALDLCRERGNKPVFCHNIYLDFFRVQLKTGEFDSVKQSYEEYKSSVPKKKYPSLYVNDALVLMRDQQYLEASLLWTKAVEHHREAKRMARMAACLNKLALSQFMEGKIELARETNKKSESVFIVMGLRMPAIKAALLNLILYQNTEKLPEEVDKLKSNLDFMGLKFSDFNVQNIVRDYHKTAALAMPDDFTFPAP